MDAEWLLVADVDETLLGDDEALATLVDVVNEFPITLVANSSRPIASVRVDLDPLGVPVTGVIGALGTEVEWEGVRDVSWEKQSVSFPRDEISAILEELGPAHETAMQGAAKVSHAIPRASWSYASHELQRVGGGLRVLTSGESNFDVIPHWAGKAAAVRHLTHARGIPWKTVITAGDTEIDAEMILAAKGVAVGNATADLRRLLDGRAFQATQPFAGGIVEGLAHYGAISLGVACG